MNADSPFEAAYALAEIRDVAQQFWQWAARCRVFSFTGSLGAGKTTLIHTLCDLLGVQDAVSSPTFALINEYRVENPSVSFRCILHMDWYRLQSLDEAIEAGMEDALLREDALCFVEWPGHAPQLLTMPHVAVTLTTESEQRHVLRAELILPQ